MLKRRNWVPETCEARVTEIATWSAAQATTDIAARLDTLAADNRRIWMQARLTDDGLAVRYNETDTPVLLRRCDA